MKLITILSLALNSVFHSKIRSWLTILGIIVGVSSFVAILALGQGMEDSIQSRTATMQLDVINITPGFSRATEVIGIGGGGRGGGMPGGITRIPESTSSSVVLTEKDISTLKTIPGINAINKEISGQTEIYFTGESIKRSITGVDVINWLKITNIELTNGRLLGPSDKYSVLIGERLAKDSFSKKIPLNTIITINNKSFRVVGIIKNSAEVIAPLDVTFVTLEEKTINEYDKITIKVDEINKVDEIVEIINTKLMFSRRIISERQKDFSVSAIKDNIESINEMTNSMIMFLTIIAAISLIVGAIGIANTMFTSVLEKTKEIGIMKSIGASSFDILFLFILVSSLYGLVGGFLGVLIGSVLSGYLGNSIGIGMVMRIGGEGSFSFALAIYGIVIAVGISVLSGFIPAYRAAKLKPVDALRYE
jgi:putative ABC transport system permease protein